MERIDRWIPYLAHEQEELRGVLGEMQRDAGLPWQVRFPATSSPLIWEDLRGGKRVDVKGLIRRIHNFYGWMAKAGSKRGKRGNCAGALYRTVQFMKIPREKRNGTKQREKRTIHIEHTVPIAVLARALRAKYADFESPSSMHRFLINKSVCVGFSHVEEAWLSKAKIPPSTNEAFDDGFPFRRYARLVKHAKTQGSEFRIINVVTGREVNLEQFSFAQHVESLAIASRLVPSADGSSLYDLDLFGSFP